LVELQQRATLAKNVRLVGETVEVLTEGPSRKNPDMATARTRTNKVVHFPGRADPGRLLDVVVERAAPSHLIARLA
jgi:tRNA-2-methylthio-N6-dimethylallyladenosine synthase